MTHRWAKMSWMAIVLLLASALTVSAQQLQQEYDNDRGDSDYDNNDDYRSTDVRDVRIDRYLTADVWTDRSDGEYYEGDNVTIHFRVNRDAYVAIYSIDSRGRVDLIFPADPSQDNFVSGGVTYSLPDGRDNYDLVVSGPKGTENLQIVASRERFPIPNWYRNSGLICDWDNRNDYMDDLNGRYFVRYDGQRFAYDRAVIFVDEWEPDYFRPTYYPYYPGWAVCGNVYIDYPWGGAVYVNGIYWGCAPLYIPRLLVGWHTLTIYDPYGYCWENDIHISRYNTLILDRTIIKTRQTTVSKYKEVRAVGYRDPIKSGYPDYDKRVAVMKSKATRTDAPVIGSYGSGKQRTNITQSDNFAPTLQKKFVRGDAKVIQSTRGIETDGTTSRGRRPDIEQRDNNSVTNTLGSRKTNRGNNDVIQGGTNRDGGTTYNGRRKAGATTTIDNPSTDNARRGGGQTTIERRRTNDNSGTVNPPTQRKREGSAVQPSTETRRPAVDRRRDTGETRKVDRQAEQPRQRQPEAKQPESKPSNPPAVKEKPAPAPAPAPSDNGGGKSKGDGGNGRGHGRGKG